MKKLKRKLALVLASCMVMTSVLPVFAEPVFGPGGAEDLFFEAEEMEFAPACEASTEELEYGKATPSGAEYMDEIIPELSGLPGATYAVSTNVVPAGSARVVLSKNDASAGEKVSFVIENDSTLSVSGVSTEPETELSVSDGGIWSFKMPAGDTVVSVELSNQISVGGLLISASGPLVSDVDYSYSDGCLTILTDRSITVRNADPQTPAADRIYVPANSAAHLVLSGINIRTTAYDTPAVCISDDSDQTVRLSLAEGTKNLLYAEQDSAIRKRGGGYLVIDGDGCLDARGDAEFCPVIGGRGTVSAPEHISGIKINGGHIYIGTITKRDASGLALTGIGGGYNASASDIVINGGEITFEGFKNPVGGGYDPYGKYSGSKNIVYRLSES